MISRERLEKTIRGVILEFSRENRIAQPTADELAAALTDRMGELLEREVASSYTEIDDSVSYVNELRDHEQLDSANAFLEEIVAWQQQHSS